MLPLLLWTVAMATCCPLIVNSYSMELSPSSAMRKSRVSRMQRGMLPSGMYAVLRTILIAQIGFELACPEPGCDGVLSDFTSSRAKIWF